MCYIQPMLKIPIACPISSLHLFIVLNCILSNTYLEHFCQPEFNSENLFHLKEYLANSGKSGTVKLFGYPSAEKDNGKTLRARAGVFDDHDAAFT